MTDLSAFGHDPIWLILVKSVGVFVFLLLTVLAAILIERKLLGRMQMRFGPNRVGPFGLLQSLADGVKLALKEGLTPAGVRPSLSASLTPSTSDCSSPCGPTRLGPYRACMRASTLRSTRIATSTVSTRNTKTPMALASISHHGSWPNTVRSG